MGRTITLAGGIVMGQSDTMVGTPVETEFGAEMFKRNAALYAQNRRVIDAIATGIAKPTGGYDSFDDALATITAVWKTLREQAAKGAEYTPPISMGFGSSNAAQVGSALTGDRTSVGEIRKAYALLGK